MCRADSPLWPVPDPQAPQHWLEPGGAHAKVLGSMALVVEEHLHPQTRRQKDKISTTSVVQDEDKTERRTLTAVPGLSFW